MQYFKETDEIEKKVALVIETVAADLSAQKTLFFEDAYNAAPLGDAIYNTGRAPLTTAIVQSIFRLSFNEIFTSFGSAGTFESYLSVFEKIFGDDVVVTFTVPAPGKLNIDVASSGLELSNFVERIIVDNAYVFNPVITQDLDNIVFQTVKGFQAQYELELMLNEMVPAGIFTDISLTVG